MRIAIVDQTQAEQLQTLIRDLPEHEIAWVAYNGIEAITRYTTDLPDLVLIGQDTSDMNCAELTRCLMRESPCAILLLARNMEHDSALIFEAMGEGALDVIHLSLSNTDPQFQHSREAFLKKINTINKLRKFSDKTGPKIASSPRRNTPLKMSPLVVIGCSTGGPKSLLELLTRLPPNLQAAVVIIQHVEQEFSAGLADWLDMQTPFDVRLATAGNSPQAGRVYVAGTNDHLVIDSHLRFVYTPEPRSLPYRPSVDVFFKSVAKYWPSKGVGVILTGMGRDGAEGLAVLSQSGWHTIAQDQASSIVYGMPKAAKEIGAAREILPLDKIAASISRHSFG